MNYEKTKNFQTLLKKHICLVCHPYTALKDIGAGGDRYAYELANHIAKHVGKLEILESGIIRSFGNAAFKELFFQMKLFSKKADIYHAVASVSANSALRQSKRPLVTTIHDLIALHVNSKQDTALKFKFKAHCIKNAAKKSDLIIVPFLSSKESLINNVGIKEEKIRLVTYGVDHQQFYPSPRPKNTMKKVFFVGALNKGKGVDSLVLCWDRVIAKYPDAQLILASKGWDSQYIKELVAQCKHNDKIRIIGFIPEDKLREAYSKADLTIFPSRYGFGLPVLESMASGTPTISGNTLDAPEFVGDAGLLVDPDDLEDMSEKIVTLLADGELSRSLVEKGIEKAKHYDWKIAAIETMDVYQELL